MFTPDRHGDPRSVPSQIKSIYIYTCAAPIGKHEFQKKKQKKKTGWSLGKGDYPKKFLWCQKFLKNPENRNFLALKHMFNAFFHKNHKGPLLGLRQFVASEISFKMTKKCILFHVKRSFSSQDIQIFVLTSWSCRKTTSKEVKFHLKIYDVKDWITNNYNTHIYQ